MTATTAKEAVMLWLERLIAAFFVISFVLYPTVMKYSGQLLVCKTIDRGVLRQTQYLSIDMSIECSGWKFEAFRVIAVVVLVVFGLGFPIGAMMLIKLFRRVSHNRRRTAQLFQFVVGGYEPHLWFWESVMMARKAAIAFANFGISDVSLRSYVMMWTIAIGFTLDVVFVPFRNKRQQIVDALAMAAIAVSLNLVQLFPLIDEDTESGIAWMWVITCVAIAVNMAAIAAVIWALSGTLREIILAADVLPAWALARIGDSHDARRRVEKTAESTQEKYLQLAQCHPRLAVLQRAVASIGPTAAVSLRKIVKMHDRLSRDIPGRIDVAPDGAPSDLRLMYAVEHDLFEIVLQILGRRRASNATPHAPLPREGSEAINTEARQAPATFGRGLGQWRTKSAGRFDHMSLQVLTPPDPLLETDFDFSDSFESLPSSEVKGESNSSANPRPQ